MLSRQVLKVLEALEVFEVLEVIEDPTVTGAIGATGATAGSRDPRGRMASPDHRVTAGPQAFLAHKDPTGPRVPPAVRDQSERRERRA